MELLGNILIYLVFRPILFALQALAGLLSTDANSRHKGGWWAGVALLMSGCIILGLCWLFGRQISLYFLIALYVLGFVLLAAASAIGYDLEKQSHRPK